MPAPSPKPGHRVVVDAHGISRNVPLPPRFLTAYSGALAAAGAALFALLVAVSLGADLWASSQSGASRFPHIARSREPFTHRGHVAADPLFSDTFSRTPALALPERHRRTWLGYLSSWSRSDANDDINARDDRTPLVTILHVGEELDVKHGGFTRCATASYAVLVYMCGGDAAVMGHTPAIAQRSRGTDGLRKLLATARTPPAQQLVVEIHIQDDEDASFGHVFTIHILPSGAVSIYMSFIHKYTLGTYVTGSRPRDDAGLEMLLADLSILEASSGTWGPAAHQAYLRAFNVDLDEKRTAGVIEVSFTGVCVIPPWNGTHADVTQPGHHAAVVALLARPLHAASLASAELPAVGAVAASQPLLL